MLGGALLVSQTLLLPDVITLLPKSFIHCCAINTYTQTSKILINKSVDHKTV